MLCYKLQYHRILRSEHDTFVDYDIVIVEYIVKYEVEYSNTKQLSIVQYIVEYMVGCTAKYAVEICHRMVLLSFQQPTFQKLTGNKACVVLSQV